MSKKQKLNACMDNKIRRVMMWANKAKLYGSKEVFWLFHHLNNE